LVRSKPLRPACACPPNLSPAPTTNPPCPQPVRSTYAPLVSRSSTCSVDHAGAACTGGTYSLNAWTTCIVRGPNRQPLPHTGRAAVTSWCRTQPAPKSKHYFAHVRMCDRVGISHVVSLTSVPFLVSTAVSRAPTTPAELSCRGLLRRLLRATHRVPTGASRARRTDGQTGGWSRMSCRVH
jgi:hypothetical protein